jgi:predicted N-acetyltransferase YhbS
MDRRTTTVRPTVPDDHDAVLALVFDAFSDGTRDGHEEVEIVAETWAHGAVPDGFDLVAVEDREIEDREIVGHVLGAWGDLDGRDVLGIAPLAVAPAHQGRGVGTALMTGLLGRAESAGLPLVVLLGAPAYYGRFGFEPSGPLGITYRPVGPDNPDFQVKRLSAYDASLHGEFAYCWERDRAQ